MQCFEVLYMYTCSTCIGNMCLFSLPLKIAQRCICTMENGCVERKIIKCLIIGAARVGKTAIKQLLLSKDPSKESESIGVMENPVHAVSFSRAMEKDGKEDEMWSIANNDDDMMRIIAEHLHMKPLEEETKSDYKIMSTGNQSSLSTLNIEDVRNDSALEPLQEQTNPDDEKIQSTEKACHDENIAKRDEANMSYQLSQRKSCDSNGSGVEINI